MLHQRVSRSSFLTVSRLAAKRALPQGSRIIWYFPTGISAQALTARAFIQAEKFGAQFAVPVSVVELDCSRPPMHRVELDNGISVSDRTVVIASGARYRRPEIENLNRFEGTSVSYWATPIEANLCEGRDIVLVGGGNSAGQAAVFLARSTRRVHLVVRSSGLDASMSRYLIDRIAATPNIELRVHTAVTALSGTADGTLESVGMTCRKSGDTWKVDAQHMFLLIGADPDTEWLDRRIALDDKGFVTTGYSSIAAGDQQPWCFRDRRCAVGLGKTSSGRGWRRRRCGRPDPLLSNHAQRVSCCRRTPRSRR